MCGQVALVMLGHDIGVYPRYRVFPDIGVHPISGNSLKSAGLVSHRHKESLGGPSSRCGGVCPKFVNVLCLIYINSQTQDNIPYIYTYMYIYIYIYR
jgi:hypothetical protein